ncbi:Protein phosphatase 2C [Giardia muris]|uniref:Protein phosphatase 2C n=1 Tax=Giardia muris TaxID=5742 RepID=A0A4Z1TB84_GIAMU|nr:Protein phosphatase 2C [Giardia muris]|eukprot:TNJ29791.1 Protein phosphatase 2C [Giardia muris]
MAFFSNQSSAFVWGSSIFHNSKGQDCRSLDFFKDSEHFFAVVGVYDGHGMADFASMYASEYLPSTLAKAVSKALKQPDHRGQSEGHIVATALCNALLNADARYAVCDPPGASSRSGSTVVMCLEMGNDLYFVNTGDSRACVGALGVSQSDANTCNTLPLGAKVARLNALKGIDPPYCGGECLSPSQHPNDRMKNGAVASVEPTTIDHCASENQREITRCRLAGATISQNRLFPETCLHWWSFMLTRTFGNTFSKGKAMIVNPDIFHKPVIMTREDIRAMEEAGEEAAGDRHAKLTNPHQLRNPSQYYDLRTGTVGSAGTCTPVDYVILASDGVWAVLKNEEVHQIIHQSVQDYLATSEPDCINPCLIASRITHVCMEKVAKDDLYSDDITIVLGLRRACIFAGDKEAARANPDGFLCKETGECINLSRQKEVLSRLDAWYSEIQALFKEHYKLLATREQNTYETLLKLLYTDNSQPMTHPTNRFRFLFDIDRVIRNLHVRYQALKGEGRKE